MFSSLVVNMNAAAAAIEDADGRGQDSVPSPQPGRSAIPAEQAADGRTVALPYVSAMPDLTSKGFVIDDFLDYDDFDHAVVAMVEWMRDRGKVLVTWGLWQQIMRMLSEVYVDSAPERSDPELNRLLSLTRIKVHEVVLGSNWRRGFVSEERLRSPLSFPLLASSVGQGGQGGVRSPQQGADAAMASPVTEAALRQHQALSQNLPTLLR